MIVVALVLTCVTGCSSDERRVVLIPPVVTDPETLVPSDIIRVGPGVKGKVYFPTKDDGWELSGNDIVLPEGWYLIPPPKEK
jgi:hypothetical protein